MGNSPLGSAAAVPGGRITHYFSDTAWIDGRATQQLAATAGLPGMVAVAGYPDLHPGRNGPVGAAFLADRLFPALVGNDIGCGMALFTLDLAPRKLSLDKAARRLRALEGEWDDAPEARGFGFGTIGGGNHFCEVQSVETLTDTAATLGLGKDRLCRLVHSGSRGLGESTYRRTEGQPSLDPDSAEGRAYLADHDRAVGWAAANRLAVATRAARVLNADFQLLADAPHNLLVPAGGAWLHRKGEAVATGASVPLAGSRDSFSYLLAPTGAAETPFASVSHGAGRKHERVSMHGRIRETQTSLQAHLRTALGGMVLCEDPDLLIKEAGSAYKSAGRGSGGSGGAGSGTVDRHAAAGPYLPEDGRGALGWNRSTSLYLRTSARWNAALLWAMSLRTCTARRNFWVRCLMQYGRQGPCLGPIVAAIIAPWLPGLSEACGGEVGASLVAGGLALAQGAVNFVAGYVVKERE